MYAPSLRRSMRRSRVVPEFTVSDYESPPFLHRKLFLELICRPVDVFPPSLFSLRRALHVHPRSLYQRGALLRHHTPFPGMA